MIHDPSTSLDIVEYSASLAAGQRVPVTLLEYFSLTLGLGLQVRVKGRGGIVNMPLNFVFGDGQVKWGNVELLNPTGGAITYRVLTSSRRFIADSPFNGTVAGTNAAGTAPNGNPILVAGQDGANVQTLKTDTAGRAEIVGPAAHGAAVSSAPIMNAAEAVSAERAAVAGGQVARLITDLVGKLIVRPHANPENRVRATLQLIAAGAAAFLPAAGAGIKNYVTSLVITNGSATADYVIILDGVTELFRAWIPSKDTKTFYFEVPEDGTANTALNVNIGGASNDIRFHAIGYTGH